MTRSDIDGEGPDPLQLRLFSLEGRERKQEVIALVQAVDNSAGTPPDKKADRARQNGLRWLRRPNRRPLFITDS